MTGDIISAYLLLAAQVGQQVEWVPCPSTGHQVRSQLLVEMAAHGLPLKQLLELQLVGMEQG